MATLLPFSTERDRKSGVAGGGPSPAAPSELSDAELVTRAESGEAAAEGEIYVRHRRGVARTIAALLGPEAETEDLVHETFMRAYQKLGELESDAKLGAWLRGIAVFVAREWLKKKARRKWSLFEVLPDLPTRETPEGVRDALRDTFDVLARMPVDERLAFSLRYIEGLEIDALALAMDMSPSTAKRRLRDAEARFRGLCAKRPSLREYLEGVLP